MVVKIQLLDDIKSVEDPHLAIHLVDNASCYEHYSEYYWDFVPTMTIVWYNKSLVTYPKG